MHQVFVVFQCITLVVTELSFKTFDMTLLVDYIQCITHLFHKVLYVRSTFHTHLIMRDHHNSSIKVLQSLH